MAVPEEEAWIFKNAETLRALQEGLKESGKGLGVSLGSFAEYAGLVLEDE